MARSWNSPSLVHRVRASTYPTFEVFVFGTSLERPVNVCLGPETERSSKEIATKTTLTPAIAKVPSPPCSLDYSEPSDYCPMTAAFPQNSGKVPTRKSLLGLKESKSFPSLASAPSSLGSWNGRSIASERTRLRSQGE